MTTKIANRINERLENLNLRPSDLSRTLNVPRATVSQWVHGEVNPRYDNLEKISKALDVDFYWLATGERRESRSTHEHLSKQDVANRIKRRKKDLRLSVKDLEEMTFSSNSTVNQWLRGETCPNIEKIELLSTTLLCTKEWLLFGTGAAPEIPEKILGIDEYPELPDVSERIKHRMEVLDLKAIDISRNVGVGKGSVHQWIHGISTPSGRYIADLAEFLKCDVQWLLTGKTDNFDKPTTAQVDTSTVSSSISTWDESTEVTNTEVVVPLITDDELNQLKRANQLDYSEIQSGQNKYRGLRFAKSSLDKASISPEHVLCVKINIPAMEPLFPADTTIGVDMGRQAIKDGKIYAFWHYQTFRVAYLYQTPDGGLRIKSVNETEYPEEKVNCSDRETVVLIGHIFWYSVMFDYA